MINLEIASTWMNICVNFTLPPSRTWVCIVNKMVDFGDNQRLWPNDEKILIDIMWENVNSYLSVRIYNGHNWRTVSYQS